MEKSARKKKKDYMITFLLFLFGGVAVIVISHMRRSKHSVCEKALRIKSRTDFKKWAEMLQGEDVAILAQMLTHLAPEHAAQLLNAFQKEKQERCSRDKKSSKI